MTEHVEFVEARRILAERAGISLDSETSAARATAPAS